MIIAKLRRLYDMPASCDECDPDFAQAIRCNHWMEGQTMYQGRPPMCPLVELDEADLKVIQTVAERIKTVL